jgi:hypothetical protein
VNDSARSLVEADIMFRTSNEAIISAETNETIPACLDMAPPFAEIADLLYA